MSRILALLFSSVVLLSASRSFADVVIGAGKTLEEAKRNAAAICADEDSSLREETQAVQVEKPGIKPHIIYQTQCTPGPNARVAEPVPSELDGLLTASNGLEYSFPPAHSRGEYCERIKDPDSVRRSLYDSKNRFDFDNPAGLFSIGLCWWYSMLQRNAAYLAVFRPELPFPTREEAVALISDLASARGVVEIPGFKDLQEFSYFYQSELIQALDTWQIADGILFGGWIRDLASKKDLVGDELSGAMDELYDNVRNKKRVSFALLVPPSIGSHAWLILNMAKTNEGYVFDLLDSNFLYVIRRHYRRGMRDLPFLGDLTATLELDRNFMDFKAYENATANYCERGITSRDLRDRGN